jgi:zinc transport system substrate-binding protein
MKTEAVKIYSMSRIWPVLAVLLTLLLFWGKSVVANEDESPHRRTVFVSIPPQAYIVQEIAGETVEIEILLPPGQSPTTYEPTPKQMVRLAECDLFFAVGLLFEQRLLGKLTAGLGQMNTVDTREGIELLPMLAHHRGEHDHTGTFDPHFWLDPNNVKIQATTICRALCILDTIYCDNMERNLQALIHRLDSVDAAIRDMFAPLHGKRMYVFHPAYGYFANAYGIEQVAIEVEGKAPSIRQLMATIEQAERDETEVLFAQPQFPAEEVETMAKELSARVLLLDPMDRDYLNNLWQIATTVGHALGLSDDSVVSRGTTKGD